jgi:hypothetical protein
MKEAGLSAVIFAATGAVGSVTYHFILDSSSVIIGF